MQLLPLHAASEPPTAAMSDGPDEAILPRVARGEPGAPEALVDRYGRLVWALARRAVPDDEVDDAVQDAFVSLWRNAERFDAAVASETTFVAMIARRRIVDRQRRRARRPDRGPGVAPPPDDALEQPPAPSRAAADDEQARVRAAMGRLRPEQRLVISLAVGRGCSHEQVARTTGMPLGTVKTHARRGMQRLRELLAAGDDAARTDGEVDHR